MDLVQDCCRDAALEHPSFHPDVNKSRKAVFFFLRANPGPFRLVKGVSWSL